jgi:Tfp pilus assembly ATPase PilU
MAEGEFYGMQTFDQALVKLVMQGLAREEDAMDASSNPHDFSLALKSARLGEESARQQAEAEAANPAPPSPFSGISAGN